MQISHSRFSTMVLGRLVHCVEETKEAWSTGWGGRRSNRSPHPDSQGGGGSDTDRRSNTPTTSSSTGIRQLLRPQLRLLVWTCVCVCVGRCGGVKGRGGGGVNRHLLQDVNVGQGEVLRN